MLQSLKMKKLISFAIAIILFFESFCQGYSFPKEKLDSFILRTMEDWHTMGVSVAIVKKDSLILAKGYGYRDYSNKLFVTENTIFPIASCSKTFASGLMGMASDEKKIEVNKPVHQYLPQFRLYSDELTKHATIEDLLSHSTGVPGHDWAWTFNTNFPEQVYLERLRHLQPSAPLHTKFQYNSFMFFVLSVLGEKLYNKGWNDLVHEKFFQPLEMNNSYGSSMALPDRNDFTLTYEYKDSFLLDPTRQMDDLLAGGSLLSTATDLAHWLQMWINGGSYKNKQILSSQYTRKAITPCIVVEDELSNENADEPFMNMGLSWFLSSYRGHYKAHHTGNVAGYSSSITFFPFDSVGIVVLTNQNNSPLIRLVPNFIADVCFNLIIRDRNSTLLNKRKENTSKEKKPGTITPDSVTKKLPFTLIKYCGDFYNPGYGPIKVTPYSNKLLLTYYDLKLVLFPKGAGHSFSSHFLEDNIISENGTGEIKFKFDKNGNVSSFTVPFEPSVKDIIFTRKKIK